MIPDKSKMEYRYLGNSGLKVSVMGFGNMVNPDEKVMVELMKKCLEHGVNFFDTAEFYNIGKSEISLGKAIKELQVPREKIVVTTKIYQIGDGPNENGQGRKHIIEGLKNSLKRLQLDYVDIVYSHRYDLNVPIEETVRAYNYLIDKGYALYWGTSEWTATQIMEAYKVCDKLNLVYPIVEQCQYNMLNRQKMENEYRDIFKWYKMGTSIWSPLLSGVLTGKYIDGIPKDSRLNDEQFRSWIPEYFNYKVEWDEKLKKLKDIAEKKLNCTLTQLALAWAMKNPDVSTCMVGATKPEQLEESLKSVEFIKKLDKEILTEIENIIQTAPEGEMDNNSFTPLPSRRNILLGVNYIKK